jgi:hypothetical protein
LNFYPNSAIYYGSDRYSVSVAVTSDVVLTRKSAASVAPAKAKAKKAGAVKTERVKANQQIKSPARPMSRTAIGKKVEYKGIGGPKNRSMEQRADLWFEGRR